jgi:hypothetical protein
VAIAFVQTVLTSAAQPGAISQVLSIPGGVTITAGNSLIVCVATNGSKTLASVSDTKSNSYAVALSPLNGSNGSANIAAAHNVAAMTSSDTITVTLSASTTTVVVSVLEFSGLATSSVLDQTASGTGGSTSPATASSGTTAQNDELLIGAFMAVMQPTATTFTAGASYTAQTTIGTTVGSNDRSLITEYRIVSSTGAYTASGTFGATKTWSAALATYKASAGTTPSASDSAAGTDAPANALTGDGDRQHYGRCYPGACRSRHGHRGRCA